MYRVQFRAWAARAAWSRNLNKLSPSRWVKAHDTRFTIFEPSGFPSLKVGSLQAAFGDNWNLVSFTLTEREALEIYENIFEANHGHKPYLHDDLESWWDFES